MMKRSYIRTMLKRYLNIHLQGNKPNIFVFSTARSGSTWLMELIASQRDIKFIDEPLHISNYYATRNSLNPSWEFVLPRAGRESEFKEYFDDLIRNRNGIGSPSPLSKFYRPVSRRIVFKVLRAKDMMNWFEDTFKAKIIYLVRHPLPTAISRERFGRLPLFLDNDLYCERYLTPELRSYGFSILKRGSDLEKKILDWCLQNLPPIRFLDRSNWLCLHYEDMVAQPEECIEKVAAFLELRNRRRMYDQIKLPSKSTVYSEAKTRSHLEKPMDERDSSLLLSRWRSKVDEESERKAFDILKRFQIDLYAVGKDLPVKRL